MVPNAFDELAGQRVAELVAVVCHKSFNGVEGASRRVVVRVLVEPLSHPVSKHAHRLERAELPFFLAKLFFERRLKLRHCAPKQADLGRPRRVHAHRSPRALIIASRSCSCAKSRYAS